MKVDEFVIQVRYGGLGDHLFWSHLPRIAKTTGGYKRVFISKSSVFAHDEYRELIWKMNPYVDGFTDADAPAPSFSELFSGANLLDMLMLDRGLDDGRRYHEPEVYYKPKYIKELGGKRVLDPNYISNVGALSGRRLKAYLGKIGGIDYQLPARAKTCAVLIDAPILQTANIFDYCDIIASCQTFLCLTSGGATLAPALGRHACVFFGYGQNPSHRHSRLNSYIELSSPFSCIYWPFTQMLRRTITKGAILASQVSSWIKSSSNRNT